jgi:hypothetical protein
MQRGQPPQAAVTLQEPRLRPLLPPLQQLLIPMTALTAMATTAGTIPSQRLLNGNISSSW